MDAADDYRTDPALFKACEVALCLGPLACVQAVMLHERSHSLPPSPTIGHCCLHEQSTQLQTVCNCWVGCNSKAVAHHKLLVTSCELCQAYHLSRMSSSMDACMRLLLLVVNP